MTEKQTLSPSERGISEEELREWLQFRKESDERIRRIRERLAELRRQRYGNGSP